jgi:nucleoside-diphosphate-sugar epimerase
MRVLLTGGSGFIGGHLRRHLAAAGVEVVLLVRRDLPGIDVPQLRMPDDPAVLAELLAARRFDGVIHLATRFQAGHAAADIPAMVAANVTFAALALDAAAQAGVRWFLNTGTYWQHYRGAAYDPVNLYAATKQAFEDIGRFYAANGAIDFCTLCLNDTYGRGDSRPKLFNLLRNALVSGETLEMSGGEQTMNILHVDDVCAAFLLLAGRLDADRDGALNNRRFALSSDEPCTIRELAGMFEAIGGRDLRLLWGKRPYRVREVMLPACPAEPLPGWSPRIPLRQGIADFLGATP